MLKKKKSKNWLLIIYLLFQKASENYYGTIYGIENRCNFASVNVDGIYTNIVIFCSKPEKKEVFPHYIIISIILCSLECNTILLICSVKILCIPLLSLCSVFNIDLLFPMNSMLILFFSTYSVLLSSWVASKQFL